nr:hypothetical protein [Tanacetum cinerariifolium]
MRNADVILGIKIKHESNVSTPLDTCEKLMPNKGSVVSQLEYSRVIGCLMYDMTCTRPDIAFVVGKLSRHMGSKWIFKRNLKDFKQNSGIDYFDTYAPVARISTIRLLIAMASIHNLIIHQMDVKKAFLNGKLKEEAPKQWHQKFDEVVLSNGYLLNQADKCVYNKFDESGILVILVLSIGKQFRVYSGYPSVLEGYTDASWISDSEDNLSTSGWAYSQMYNGKSRYLGVRHSMIRELITNGVISIEFVRIVGNLVNCKDLLILVSGGRGMKCTPRVSSLSEWYTSVVAGYVHQSIELSAGMLLSELADTTGR